MRNSTETNGKSRSRINKRSVVAATLLSLIVGLQISALADANGDGKVYAANCAQYGTDYSQFYNCELYQCQTAYGNSSDGCALASCMNGGNSWFETNEVCSAYEVQWACVAVIAYPSAN